MAAISQTIFSYASSWMKTFEFIEMCSSGFNWQYIITGSDNCLVPNMWQAIIWISDGLVYWRIYASLGLELTESIDF